jgi:hypothetical protein
VRVTFLQRGRQAKEKGVGWEKHYVEVEGENHPRRGLARTE